MAEAARLVVERLGHEGDGLVGTGDATIVAPGALPGDTIAVDEHGQVRVEATGDAPRAAPACRHFGACGGRVAQHMAGDLYRSWKRDLLVTALARQNVAATVVPMVSVAPGSRRRVVLTAARQGSRVALGYHRRRSNEVLAIEECPVAVGAIAGRLALLRTLAEAFPATAFPLRVVVIAAAQGLDVAIERERPAPLSMNLRRTLVASAVNAGLARLSVDSEPIVSVAEPLIETGSGALSFPPGAFVQASAEAEAMIAALIEEGIGKSKTAADLFAGVGTFTFTVARRARTLAVDGERPAIEALMRNARRIGGVKPIETKVRDLFAEPLSPRELAAIEAVVLDPPRAGAKAQCEALAQSTVRRVVMVSCNPATLARDLAILFAGGFKVRQVTPIDQFLWSSHLEAVAVLSR